MYSYASLLNTQHYKVRIKGNVEPSREGVAPSPTSWCSSYRKGSLRVTLDYGRQLTYFYQILIICTELYDIKYSDLIQIICIHMYDIKYSYLIQVIHAKLYDIKYSYQIPTTFIQFHVKKSERHQA